MDAKEKLEALASGTDGDPEQTEDWPPAEEFNAMLDEVSGSVSADAYEDDDWMDDAVDEVSNDKTLPAGEMELIFENEYIM
jgi:hypothetical protein